MSKNDSDNIRQLAEDMKKILGLAGSPIGVRLLPEDEVFPPGTETLLGHRYCQALMRARHGKDAILGAEGISCPAAASAFGFKELPMGLKSGKGLVGFGIVSDEEVGKKMLGDMVTLSPGTVKWIHVFPLEKALQNPDIVVVEDQVERLMWIVLSYLHTTGGTRVPTSTAVLQATCVDSTIIPFLEKRLNFSYGCYGCRDATDIESGEAVLGFPGAMLPGIMSHLKYLSKKAIPTSRSKKALRALKKDISVDCAA